MGGFLLHLANTPPPYNDEVAKATVGLREELAQQNTKTAELRGGFAVLTTVIKRKKIKSFEELAQKDKEIKQVLVELAQQTEPMQMNGKNIALFGQTSTGKSTMVNALLGQNLAETTMKIKAYPGTHYTLWDVPVENDEVSYLSMEYISFFKGLTRRLVLIQATVKENSSMMKLLDELNLGYDIVFNKFDKVDVEEQPLVKAQIEKEIKELGLRKVGKVFFVSAKNTKMFDDWRVMVDHLIR